MRWFPRKLLAVTVVVVVFLLVLAGTSLPALLNPSGRAYNEQLLGQCNVSWPPEMPVNSSQRSQFTVFLLQPGTTSRLCVGYSSLSSSSVALDLRAQFLMLNRSTGLIESDAQPHNLYVPGNNNGLSPTGVAYAVYTFHPTSSTKGFFLLSLPGFCPAIPVAVGYSPSEVNATDFAGWLAIGSCGGSQSVTGEYVSVLNLNVAYPYSR